MMNRVNDSIQMTLKANLTVQAESSIVNIVVQILATEDKNYNQVVTSKLKKLATVTPWILSANQKRQDNGYDRIELGFTTRMTEEQTLGLTDKLKELDEKGINFHLQNIKVKPTNKQYEDAYKELRKKIYEKAKEELASIGDLDQSTPFSGEYDSRWRISHISFDQIENMLSNSSNNMRMSATVAAGSYSKSLEGGDEEGSNLSTKLEIEAQVAFARMFA